MQYPCLKKVTFTFRIEMIVSLDMRLFACLLNFWLLPTYLFGMNLLHWYIEVLLDFLEIAEGPAAVRTFDMKQRKK